jgi:hypothetical protein
VPAVVHAAVAGFPELLADHAAGRRDARLAPTVIERMKQLVKGDRQFVTALKTSVEQDAVLCVTTNPESMGAVATEFAVLDGWGWGRHGGWKYYAVTTPKVKPFVGRKKAIDWL